MFTTTATAPGRSRGGVASARGNDARPSVARGRRHVHRAALCKLRPRPRHRAPLREWSRSRPSRSPPTKPSRCCRRRRGQAQADHRPLMGHGRLTGRRRAGGTAPALSWTNHAAAWPSLRPGPLAVDRCVFAADGYRLTSRRRCRCCGTRPLPYSSSSAPSRCAEPSFESHPLATRPVPIVVPSIQARASEELPRIVDADAFDAIRTLGDAWFLDEDRAWVLKHAAGRHAHRRPPCDPAILDT